MQTSLKSEDMSKLGAEKFDHVVIGADIGGLYCAGPSDHFRFLCTEASI